MSGLVAAVFHLTIFPAVYHFRAAMPGQGDKSLAAEPLNRWAAELRKMRAKIVWEFSKNLE